MNFPSRNKCQPSTDPGTAVSDLQHRTAHRWPSDPGNSGAAMPLVLIFSTLVAITVTLYLAGQSRIARTELIMPAKLQALLTARSGVWWAMDQLRDSTTIDTLKTINTHSASFTNGLFDAAITVDGPKLTDDGTSTEVSPFTASGFGSAQVRLTNDGAFRVIQSTGTFRTRIKTVEARIGGSVIHSGDTLLYVTIQVPNLVAANVRGTKAGSFTVSREVHLPLLQKVIDSYTRQFSDDTSLGMPLPLIIQKESDIAKVPDAVNGDLSVNGLFGALTWKSKRTIRVSGDLHILGTCFLENLSFIVQGEITIEQKSQLKNVSLFSGGKLFIGDNAVFSGHVLSLGTITVFGRAHIRDRSTIVAAGGKLASAGKQPVPTARTPQPANPKDVAATAASNYGVLLSESAIIDACVFALRSPGSIKTDRNVTISGMLFAVNELSHAGKLNGIAKATRVIDGSDATSVKENVMTGSIKQLDELDSYLVPGFIGTPAIVSWSEQ